jgi:DNA repair photolyase
MDNEAARLELCVKGCLGTCWYGKYHYVEPWAGCEHGCLYCYARFRKAVQTSLSELGTSYEKPVPLFPFDELPRRILETVTSMGVKIVKLSRFTDILTPSHVASGLSYEVLSALARSPVERVILTTKGVPDSKITGLIARNPAKFSYNAALRPDQSLALEPNLRSHGERLTAAEAIRRSGVKTTVHLDPMVAGIDDAPEVLLPFLKKLKKKGLNRVMFSYLLLSDEIVALLRERLAPEAVERVLQAYDKEARSQRLPRQSDTVYFTTRPEAKRRSTERFADALRSLGFEFVLCSIKSAKGKEREEAKGCPLCDGTFYA